MTYEQLRELSKWTPPPASPPPLPVDVAETVERLDQVMTGSCGCRLEKEDRKAITDAIGLLIRQDTDNAKLCVTLGECRAELKDRTHALAASKAELEACDSIRKDNLADAHKAEAEVERLGKIIAINKSDTTHIIEGQRTELIALRAQLAAAKTEVGLTNAMLEASGLKLRSAIAQLATRSGESAGLVERLEQEITANEWRISKVPYDWEKNIFRDQTELLTDCITALKQRTTE